MYFDERCSRYWQAKAWCPRGWARSQCCQRLASNATCQIQFEAWVGIFGRTVSLACATQDCESQRALQMHSTEIDPSRRPVYSSRSSKEYKDWAWLHPRILLVSDSCWYGIYHKCHEYKQNYDYHQKQKLDRWQIHRKHLFRRHTSASWLDWFDCNTEFVVCMRNK